MPCFRFPLVALVLALTNLTSQAEKVQIQRLPVNLIQQRLGGFLGNDSAREGTLKRIFAEAGCQNITEQPVKGLKQPNVIYRYGRKPGDDCCGSSL